MDNKSGSDTNNNEALRLANHNSGNTHALSNPDNPRQNVKNVDNSGNDLALKRARFNHEGQNVEVTPPRDSRLNLARDDVVNQPSTSQISPEQRPYQQCNLCGKKCWTESDYKRHLVYHLGRKPFKCYDCGKRFQVKSNMLLHQRAAHGDRYNHEFLECPPGGGSEQDSIVGLCQEMHAPEQSARLGNTARLLTESSESRQLAQPDAGHSDGTNKSNDSSDFSKHVQACSSASPKSNSEHSGGSDDAEVIVGDEEEYSIDYPSVFPGLRHQLNVRNETVLVTRLDGINKTTKERLSLFKCHMCGKIFNLLSKLQCHLSLHFERTLNVFVCNYCDAHFQFKTQLAQHLLRTHEVDVSTSEEILDMTQLSPTEGSSPQNEIGENCNKNDDGDSNTSTPPSQSYSGFLSSSSLAVERPNSGRDENTATRPTDWQRIDEGMHYSVSARALYSRVNGMYMCQFCNKGFDRLFSLSRHERVHTGFKPCYCKYCGRGFSEPRNLRHHIIRFHSDVGERHVIKRLRKGMPMRYSFKMNRRVSHSTQRLAYVSPDIITKVDSSKDVRSQQSHLSSEEGTPKHDESEQDLPSPRKESPSLRQPIVIEPKSDSSNDNVLASRKELAKPRSDSSNDNVLASQLANEIREKEKLDADVMVVIPSDVNESKDRDATTPNKSVCSENTNWSDNDHDDVGIDGTSLANSEIMSAPIKTLISHHQRPRRKMSFTPGELRSPAPPSGHSDKHDVKPKMEPLCDLPPSSLASMYHHNNALVSVTNHLSLPFNPLNISTYGLSGLLPSPLMSPLNQAFFAQQGLTSPSMVHNPLSFFSALSNSAVAGVPTSLIPTPSTQSQPINTKDLPSIEPISTPTSGRRSTHSPAETETNSSRASHSLDDLQSWMAKGGGRGSALSRSHSSRLYVVRQPVKREDACKPVVLPDGRTVYRCTYCNKDFCTFSDVNRHMDFHEGWCKGEPDIRPYKCKYCDYYARTNSQLKVHMMRHQGIREFHCKLCNYKGVTQSDLNRHMKSQIHMMKAQNECKHCGEGFVSPKNLERHYHEKHFSQYEKMATSHAVAAHAAQLGQGSGYQGSV